MLRIHHLWSLIFVLEPIWADHFYRLLPMQCTLWSVMVHCITYPKKHYFYSVNVLKVERALRQRTKPSPKKIRIGFGNVSKLLYLVTRFSMIHLRKFLLRLTLERVQTKVFFKNTRQRLTIDSQQLTALSK